MKNVYQIQLIFKIYQYRIYSIMLNLKADLRIHHKKSATRRLRRKNKCPAIIYGHNYPNLTIELNQNTMQHPNIVTQLHINNNISLNIEYKISIIVKIQTIQYHPFKPRIIHIDFLRIL